MGKLYQNKYFIDFLAAMMFFTRIPLNWIKLPDEVPDLARASWAFTLVGLIVGFLSGFLGDILLILGLSSLLSCTIAIGFSIFITGAIHEDGLADVADGFGAGGSSEKIIEIMHDSRLGTYGMVALLLGLLIRIGISVCLVDLGYSLAVVLAIGFASGKLAILFSRLWFEPSDLASLGHSLGPISQINIAVATGIWILPVITFFPIFGVLLGVIFSSLLIYLFGIKTTQYIGGITGDVLGAVAFLSELVFLIGVLIIISGAP